MKASELTKMLLELVIQHGDLEIGIQDSEFLCFMGIDKVRIWKVAERHNVLTDDAESLGNDLFIGITGTY